MRQAVAYIFGFGMLLNAGLFIPQVIHLWRTRRNSPAIDAAS